MKPALIPTPSRRQRVHRGAGLLAAIVCAPVVVFAQTAPTPPAGAAPHYRGIHEVPPTSEQTGDAPWILPPPPSASASAAEPPQASSHPATPETSANGGASAAHTVPVDAISGRPIIRDTATLVIEGRAILLAGIEGVAGAPFNYFKDFVEAAGGTVTCVPAPGIYTYTCRLPDGSDLASIALLNGAARLSSDAPAAYRMQEEIARTNHRGIWSLSQLTGRSVLASSSARHTPPFGGMTTVPEEASAYRPR